MSQSTVSDPFEDLTKIYEYDDFPIKQKIRKTGHEILIEYWDEWKTQMHRINARYERITVGNCIRDYCTVNWAWEVETPEAK